MKNVGNVFGKRTVSNKMSKVLYDPLDYDKYHMCQKSDACADRVGLIKHGNFKNTFW